MLEIVFVIWYSVYMIFCPTPICPEIDIMICRRVCKRPSTTTLLDAVKPDEAKKNVHRNLGGKQLCIKLMPACR
jgi:hypothetical protein